MSIPTPGLPLLVRKLSRWRLWVVAGLGILLVLAILQLWTGDALFAVQWFFGLKADD